MLKQLRIDLGLHEGKSANIRALDLFKEVLDSLWGDFAVDDSNLI